MIKIIALLVYFNITCDGRLVNSGVLFGPDSVSYEASVPEADDHG